MAENYFEKERRERERYEQMAREIEDWFARQPVKRTYSVSETGYNYGEYMAFGYIYYDSIPSVITKTAAVYPIRELPGRNQSLLQCIYGFVLEKMKE